MYLARPVSLTRTTDGIAVVDATTARVHRFAVSLEPEVAFGQKGSGPGELLQPRSVRAGSNGSLWVGDTRNQRITHFSHTGERLADYPHGMPVTFAVLGDRVIAIGPSSTNPLHDVTNGGTPLRWNVPIPAELRSKPRWHPELVLVDAMTDSTLILLDNDASMLWQLGVRGEEVTNATRLRVPEWLSTRVAEVKAERLNALQLPAGREAVLPSFTSLHARPDGVWLQPLAGFALVVFLPVDAALPETVVLPSVEGEHRGLLDVLHLDADRLVGAYATELRAYRLRPSTPEAFTARLAASR